MSVPSCSLRSSSSHRHHHVAAFPKQQQVAFFDAFMALFAPDDAGIWAKASAPSGRPFLLPLFRDIVQAKLRITQGIQQQGGTSLVALGGQVLSHAIASLSPPSLTFLLSLTRACSCRSW
jgi:hypothetical protein